MEASKLEWRMYGLVPYNISPIQQGIQFGHAVVEYLNGCQRLPNVRYTEDIKSWLDACDKWRYHDKTFIILNGGTTNSFQAPGTNEPIGTLNKYLDELTSKNITLARFLEPDLGNQLTAVVFLADERVWNYEKYPPRDVNPQPPSDGISSISVFMHPETEEAYAERLGGEKNVWLREFLSKFRLA